MTALQQFGLERHRNGSGALLSSEVERIKGFLRFRGLLLAEGLGGWLVIVHPAVADRPLLNVGFQRVVLGSSLEALRRAVLLTVAETRALEILSPGPLIVAKGDDDASQAMLMAVPDSADLRDIGSASGGTATAFLQAGVRGRAQLEDVLSAGGDHGREFSNLGVLESPVGSRTAPELPTVVRISGPDIVECLVEGAFTVDRVKVACGVISQWEIGDWT